MSRSILILILVLSMQACGINENKTQQTDYIRSGIAAFTDTAQAKTIAKTLYHNNLSEEKSYLVTNWKQEFKLFNNLAFTQISQQGELVLDTTFDQRTSRYLIRGMRLSEGNGFQNLYLMLDSNRHLLQFQTLKIQKLFFSNTETFYFWNSKGEYHFKEHRQNILGSDTRFEVIAEW